MKTQKTVLFLESSKNMGGQEWQLLQQMQALNAQGFECILLCSPQARISAQAQERQLTVIHLPFRNSVHPKTIQGIVNAMKQYRPLACISHSGHDANNLSVAALFLGQKRPKIIRSRTYYTNDKKKALQSWLPLDAVMVPSRFMQNHIQKQFPSKPVHVVYPGIDFGKLDAQKNHALPESLQQFLQQHIAAQTIAHIGMLRPEKGQNITLAAVAAMRAQGCNVVLVLAGGGNDAPVREQIAALNLQDAVWLGELKAVAPLLLQADVVAMPSLKEPLGMVQIEALGLAVPVVVSNVGGVPETVIHEQTGLIVADHEVSSWQAALEQALNQPEWMQQYAQAGQKMVREQFGIARNTEQLLALIQA